MRASICPTRHWSIFCRVNNDKSHGHNFTPKDGDDVAFTVRCASGQRVDDNFLKYEDE